MKYLRRGWFHLASGAGIGRIFSFSSNLILARLLGVSDLGLFNLLLTTVQNCEMLSRCGADFAINYELGGQRELSYSAYGSQLSKALTQICTIASIFLSISAATFLLLDKGLLPLDLSHGIRLVSGVFVVLMILIEGICASAWELLLVRHHTKLLALKQGLFIPIRLFFSAVCAFFCGVYGAILGWTAISLVQFLWLRAVLGSAWQPLKIESLRLPSILVLTKRGFPFYVSNLFSSFIFFPLLLKVSADYGLSEIGYLRVGQILQQLFAFLPATLVPVLFLRLRSELTFKDQSISIEKPMRLIWFILIVVLLLYCSVDTYLISALFGDSYISAIVPTRLLLITALLECLNQLIAQPLLASGQTRTYGLWQNLSALAAAAFGWFFIPTVGITAYLIARIVYVLTPLVAFSLPVTMHFEEPNRVLPLFLGTSCLLTLLIFQSIHNSPFLELPYLYASMILVMAFFQRGDFQALRGVLPFR